MTDRWTDERTNETRKQTAALIGERACRKNVNATDGSRAGVQLNSRREDGRCDFQPRELSRRWPKRRKFWLRQNAGRDGENSCRWGARDEFQPA